MTRAAGTDWALGIRARAHALSGNGEAAERHYREAIERLGRTRLRGEHARARLLYGEWLRSIGRRENARDELRAAYEMLAGIGADGFAERARHELLATGETVRRAGAEARDALTPQEAQIARLAAAGHTNAEIGTGLFISSRPTAAWRPDLPGTASAARPASSPTRGPNQGVRRARRRGERSNVGGVTDTGAAMSTAVTAAVEIHPFRVEALDEQLQEMRPFASLR